MGEWLKPTVCKIVALTGYAGSNPAPGTRCETPYDRAGKIGGDVSAARRKGTAHVAQLAEHALGKGEVIGSNPIVGSSESESAPEGSRGAN